MAETINVLIVGVGGQGIVAASNVLANAALAAGYDVKQSEVHGMAQRGGAVSSHVRFGTAVYSPVIPLGEAEFLLSFEKLETLRWLDYLADDATVIVNDYRIDPITVAGGKAEYPADVELRLASGGYRTLLIDGMKKAEAAGNLKSVNMVLLGVLAARLDLPIDTWKSAISRRFSAESFAINWRAFELGRAVGLNAEP